MATTQEKAPLTKPEPVRFKLVYRYYATTPTKLNMISRNRKTGEITWLDKNGKLRHKSPVGTEHSDVFFIQLSTIETKEIVDKSGRNTKTKVLSTMVEYINDEKYLSSLGKERSDEMLHNLVLKEAHHFLQTHHEVVRKDSRGNNENKNLANNTFFELIDESAQLKEEIENQNLVSKAILDLNEMATKDAEGFFDFCYAYNLPGIKECIAAGNVNLLLQKASFKIRAQVETYWKAKADYERKVLVWIRKAKEFVTDEKTQQTLISVDGHYFYMDGELIGSSEEEVVAYFESRPKEKKALMSRLGMEYDIDVKIKEPAEYEASSNQNGALTKQVDEQMWGLAKSAVMAAHKAFKSNKKTREEMEAKWTEIKQNPSYAKFATRIGELIEDYKSK